MRDNGVSTLEFKLKLSQIAKRKIFAYLHFVGNMCKEGELVF
jgi:hypothetical protein